MGSALGRLSSPQEAYPFVNHFSFHILDPEWCHVTIKISSYPPFPTQIILNGHHYLARQAVQQSVPVVQQGNCFVQVRVEQLSLPACMGRMRVGGIDLGHPRMSRVAKALVALTAVCPDFTASDLARQVQRQTGRTPLPYSARQAAYDLQKFCAKGLVQHEPGDHRYRTTPEGVRLTTGLLILRERVLHPLLSALERTAALPAPSPLEDRSVDHCYQQLYGAMVQLLARLGFSTQIHNGLEIAA